MLWTGLLATSARAQHEESAPAPSDKVVVEANRGVLELSWSDYEERLRGALRPLPPVPGKPLQVQLHVGSYEGEPFDGPVTLTLREEGATQGQTRTVRRGEVNWTTEFNLEKAGPYQLDISFRTTRLKVLHAKFDVASAPIPRVVLLSLLGLIGAVAISFGIRSLLREARPPPPPPETDAPRSEVAVSAPAAEPAPAEPAPAASEPAASEPAAEAASATKPADEASPAVEPTPESEKASA